MTHAAETWESRFYVALGAQVRRYRRARGLSQGTVARRLGLTRPSVTNLEAGRQRPPVHQIAALAVMLGVGVTDLVPAPEVYLGAAVGVAETTSTPA